MCAWSRPITPNRIECLAATSGSLAFSCVTAPAVPWASAAGDTAENIPAMPAACRNVRRSVLLMNPTSKRLDLHAAKTNLVAVILQQDATAFQLAKFWYVFELARGNPTT